jgi:hypothetical protein
LLDGIHLPDVVRLRRRCHTASRRRPGLGLGSGVLLASEPALQRPGTGNLRRGGRVAGGLFEQAQADEASPPGGVLSAQGQRDGEQGMQFGRLSGPGAVVGLEPLGPQTQPEQEVADGA